MNLKKISQITAYYLLPAVLLLLSVLIPDYERTKSLGSLAIYLLTINLYGKPIALLTGHAIFRPLLLIRRELGVASFWAFLFHSLGMIMQLGLKIPQDFFGFGNFLFYGWAAGLGMYLLGLTSNDFSQRILARNWQHLHRIVYPMYFLALYHWSMATGEMWRFYFFGGVYAILKIAQFAKFNRI